MKPLIANTVLLSLTLVAPSQAQLAVKGETVYTMAGTPIRDGVVLIGADGKIQAVGPASRVTIPSGVRTLTAKVVTPGLVDAHSVVGLAGYLNETGDQDQLDRSAAIQPELRARDAYNPHETLVGWVRGYGVTTMHTGHGPGALMSGQTMVVKTQGRTVAEATVVPESMIAMTLGPEVGQAMGGRPGTRAKGMALVRAELVKAAEYARNRTGDKPPARDLRMEVLADLLDGKLQALVTANRGSEILSALRLREEFGFRLVLDGAAEAHLLIDEIKAAGVAVILHPPMARHGGSMENATFESAKLLQAAGIPFALQSGFENYVPKTRVLLFEAAAAARYGLSTEQALAAVTTSAAAIIGVGDRVGSLERGKDGDLALFDGDPFEYLTKICTTIIEGRIVSEGCR